MKVDAFFSCMAGRNWYSSNANSLHPSRERDSLRMTRVKIEFFNRARSNSLPHNLKREKKGRKANALASYSGYIFYGLGRDLRDRGDYSRGRIRTRNPDFVVFACAVVLADGLHDWGAIERPARGRRVLRMGSARTRKLLGISRSLVVFGRQHF